MFILVKGSKIRVLYFDQWLNSNINHGIFSFNKQNVIQVSQIDFCSSKLDNWFERHGNIYAYLIANE